MSVDRGDTELYWGEACAVRDALRALKPGALTNALL